MQVVNMLKWHVMLKQREAWRGNCPSCSRPQPTIDQRGKASILIYYVCRIKGHTTTEQIPGYRPQQIIARIRFTSELHSLQLAVLLSTNPISLTRHMNSLRRASIAFMDCEERKFFQQYSYPPRSISASLQPSYALTSAR